MIGGAGGSLNHLRLTGVKPAGDYKETIAARAAERRDRAKAQRESDRALGLQNSKAEAQRKVTEKTRSAGRQFVASVAKVMNWSDEDLKFDEDAVKDKPDEVVAKLRQTHEADLVKRAQAAVALNRERLLGDAEARAEADFGEIPLSGDTDLSVQDLDPIRSEPIGLGFSPDYKGRSEAHGATEADIRSEAAELRQGPTDAQRKAAIANGETARLVRENLELIRDPDTVEKLAPKLVEAKQALELLKLDKRHKLLTKQAREERKKINEAVVEPKAFVLEVDDAEVDEKVAADVANDLRTISTRAFLSEVSKTTPDPVATLGRHIGSGAYNSVNALALAAGGAALVDRSVVDVLGIAGAAQVLARRLQTDLTADELKDVAEGVADFHLNSYVEASSEAIKRARELRDVAKEIELGSAENGSDLQAMQEINRRRADAIAESQKVLGTALGEMEANAALVYALGRGKTDKPFEVSMGDIAVESALKQIRAIGLQRGDYTLTTVAGNRVLSILPQGLDRLADPVNRSDLEQTRRNLDIISGKFDEEDWLPEGVADRPDLDMHVKPGIAASFARPLAVDGDLETGVADYIGGRAADGDLPADIIADLQSADFLRKVGPERVAEYHAALNKLAPLQDADGKLHQADSLRASFETMADAYCDRIGSGRSPLHRQTFDVDSHSIDALHRALAAEPTGIAAYRQIGELTPQDQGAIREYFAKHVARESPDAAALRHDLERTVANEPEREIEDMFGDKGVNPEWSDWKAKRDDLSAKVAGASLTWPKYVESMRGPEQAYSAMQDMIRSGISKTFADSYNTLNPDKPLKLGRAMIRDNLNHLDAVDPKARDARVAKERALTDSLRERVQGRYTSGSVRDKLDAARDAQAGEDAAQMGFFADEAADDKPLGADERYTIGHEAERRIAEMMPVVGRNFNPQQPVKMFRPTMSGGKNWARQRAIKLIDTNKRVVLSFGTGSGKTLVGLGAFTNLQSQGKIKRGLFLAPSIAQGQFGPEALRFLDPGKYQWHAQPGASREERIGAYKDPKNDFAVMTHQSFRDDMLHLGAEHAGISPEEMSERTATMSRPERKAWMAGVMEREGINFDYINVDEGHNTLNRQGKENSAVANVIDAATDSSSYFVSASADPVRNDVSEAFSLLQKMDPDHYTDQAAFMRKYGVDTLAAKDSLRREMARFQYPSKIDPDITATRIEHKVGVSEEQNLALRELDKHVAAARIARMQGKVDVDAMRAISPVSFEGVADDRVEAVAKELQTNLGILKQTAIKHVLDDHPAGGKLDAISSIAKSHAGKQGVVFARSLAAVQHIRERLTRDGYRVGVLTGADSGKEKSRKIREFTPQSGGSDVDILVSSDAGATGANLQSAQWLVNADTPSTALTWCQRNGRINRTGQTHDVDLVDLVSDHPEEHRARSRLMRKYALREALTTPMEQLDDSGVGLFIRQRQIARENGGT